MKPKIIHKTFAIPILLYFCQNIARQKKWKLYSILFHEQISPYLFPFSTLSIVNIIEKSFSPPKLNRAKSYLRKIILSLIFYKDYYNLYAKYMQKKNIENSNPYQIPFIGDPSFSSPTSSYEIISNTGKIIWDLFLYT